LGNFVRTNYRLSTARGFDEDQVTVTFIAASAISGSNIAATADVFSEVIARGSYTTSCTAAGLVNIPHGLATAPVFADACLIGTSGAAIKPHTRTVTLQGLGATYLTFLVCSQAGADALDASTVSLMYAAHL